ncbi:hypothetical protein P0F65_10655 [Sphingomonas sp. I4]
MNFSYRSTPRQSLCPERRSVRAADVYVHPTDDAEQIARLIGKLVKRLPKSAVPKPVAGLRARDLPDDLAGERGQVQRRKRIVIAATDERREGLFVSQSMVFRC